MKEHLNKRELIENIAPVIENTAIITSEVPEKVTIVGTGNKKIQIDTDPSVATISVKSESESVATATASEKEITITGVAAGNAIIEITTSASGNAPFKRTIMVNVVSE